MAYRRKQQRQGVYEAPAQNVGDQENMVAGGNITYGAPADSVLDFLRQYVFQADDVRNTAVKEATGALRRAQDEMRILSDAQHALRDRLDRLVDSHARDQVERQQRQAVLNWWLGTITGVLALLALAVLWLAWRELSPPPVDPAAIARLWLGGSLAILAQLRRLL